MKIVWLIPFLGLGCFCFALGLGCNETQVQKQPNNTPYEFRSFSFEYFNATNDKVNLYSAKVLSNDASGGGMWAGGSGTTITYTRMDCTPKALLNSPAKFVWWKVDDSWNRVLVDGVADTSQAFLPFPKFDVEARSWRCHYTLIDDETWVGKFSGTLAKPPGVVAKPVLNSEGNSWLHCHFRNLANKEVLLSKWETKIVTKEHEFEPGVRFLPADKRFHGFSANCQEGSIYRLEPGDSLQIAWAFEKKDLNTRAMKKQTFLMPEFGAKKKNWYCYFTINEKEEWTATFEGTTKDAESLDK